MPIIQTYLKNTAYINFLNLKDKVRQDIRLKIRQLIYDEIKQHKKEVE